jgi:hypothetical protein
MSKKLSKTEQLRLLLDYMEEDEKKHFKECGRPKNHIYKTIRDLRKTITPPKIKAVEEVLGRDKIITGRTTGASYKCPLNGCSGWRVTVKWEDGRISYPCTEGMSKDKKGWYIQ